MTKLAMPSLCSASATKPERSAATGAIMRSGSSAPAMAMSIAARGLSCMQAPRQPFDGGRFGEVGLRDDEAVGEDHLLARLGGGFEVRLAAHGIDHGEHHVDMKFAAECAVGGEGLQDRPGIGEPGGFDHDAAERRHGAALAVENEPAQRELQIAAGDAADAAVAEQNGFVGAAANKRVVDADGAELVDDDRRTLRLPASERKRRSNVVLPAPRNPVTTVTGMRAPRSRLSRRPNGPASREGKRSSMDVVRNPSPGCTARRHGDRPCRRWRARRRTRRSSGWCRSARRAAPAA